MEVEPVSKILMSSIARIKLLFVNTARGKPGRSASSADPAFPPPARLSGLWLLPLVGLATALLCMPFIRTIYLGADEGVLLHAAERMLQGRRLYVDFFEFLPPGGFVLTAAWFSVAGISVMSARSLEILTIVGIASFTYLACRRASRNAPLSAFLTIGWVTMSQGIWTQVSHHWFTTLFSMVAIWAALTNVEDAHYRSRWSLIAGTAAGTAAMVTPTRGALVMLAALTALLDLRRNRPQLIAYVLGGALAPVGLSAYLIWHHAFVAAIYDVIQFTAERYASIQGVPFGSWAGPQNFLLVYLFPVAAVLTLCACVRDWRAFLHDRLLRLCAAFGLAGFAGCFPRPDISHIGFAAPLAFPLLACCVSRFTRLWRPAYRYAAAGVAISLCAPSAYYFSRISEKVLHAEVVPTPRGSVVLLGRPEESDLLARIVATPYGEAYFFYPFMPMLPFLTERRHVSKYDVLTPGYTLPSQYRDACISLMQQASWVVIDRMSADPNFLKWNYPAMGDTQPPETRRFEQILEGSFRLVVQAGSFELRRRGEGISDTVCADIAGP
jgi:hypothetical protein